MLKRPRLLMVDFALSIFASQRSCACLTIAAVLSVPCACSLTQPLDVERQVVPDAGLPIAPASNNNPGPPGEVVPEPTNNQDATGGTGEAVMPNDVAWPSGINLVENSSAELDSTGWSAPYGGVLSLTSDQAHNGVQSIVVSGRTQPYQGPHFELTNSVSAGQAYDVRIFAKLGGTAADSLSLTAFVHCENSDDRFLTIAQSSGADQSWTELRGQFTMPEAATCQAQIVRVYVEGPVPGVDLYVDDLEVLLRDAELPELPIVVNLVSNPDFETGVEQWSAGFGGNLSASSVLAHGGSQSALLTSRIFDYQGPQYDFTAQAVSNGSYLVRAFARPSVGTDVALKLTSRIQCEGKDDVFLTVSEERGNDAEWTELQGTLNIPGEFACSLLNVLVYVEGPEAGVDLFVDDVAIERGADTAKSLNLLGNSGFESGVDGWVAAFGGILVTTDSTAHSGSQSALVRGRTLANQGLHVDVSPVVVPGATYSFAAFARLSGAATDTIVATFRQRCDGLTDEFVQITSVVGSNSRWTLLAGEVSIPLPFDCAGGQFLLYVEGPQPAVDLLVDDISLVATEGASGAVNLIGNSDFELGVQDWTAAFGGSLSASLLQAHTGGRSALVSERTDSFQGPHWDLTAGVNQGAVYSVSAFTRVDGVQTDEVLLSARIRCDGQEDQYVTLGSAPANSTSWTMVRGQLEVPAEFDCFLQELLFYAEGPQAGVDLYLDDVWVVESSPAPQLTNLLSNPSFEEGTEGWTATEGSTLALASRQAHSGMQSALLENRSETEQGLRYNVRNILTPGTTYAVSVFARVDNIDSDTLTLTLQMGCQGQAEQFLRVDSSIGSNVNWTLLRGTISLPEEAACNLTNATLYVEGPAAGVNFFVDDTWLVELP